MSEQIPDDSSGDEDGDDIPVAAAAAAAPAAPANPSDVLKVESIAAPAKINANKSTSLPPQPVMCFLRIYSS